MKRKPKSSNYNYDRDYDNRDYDKRDYDNRDYDDYPTADTTTTKRKASKASMFNATSIAVLAGVFILGIGIGLGFSSISSSGTGKIITLSDLETQAPNADICVQFGASAITMDIRVFATLNPLNVYVSQPTTQPGCVLRSQNWSVLEQRGLIKPEQIRDCKQHMNTFGFTGKLESSPQIDCVYQNDAAKNLFLNNQPGMNGAGKNIAPENQRF